ncbi:uncharacterized protein LOC128585497 [Nycticebus coucang]|uniref:uncharacterized protein LOC128585497 n=1 Tax=Nycticebus coucang TaxID=9470 RepID=UPI00234D85B6|nr:uncharacterized protein LOC128585497 [Nycticebus coucang]
MFIELMRKTRTHTHTSSYHGPEQHRGNQVGREGEAGAGGPRGAHYVPAQSSAPHGRSFRGRCSSEPKREEGVRGEAEEAREKTGRAERGCGAVGESVRGRGRVCGRGGGRKGQGGRRVGRGCAERAQGLGQGLAGYSQLWGGEEGVKDPGLALLSPSLGGTSPGGRVRGLTLVLHGSRRTPLLAHSRRPALARVPQTLALPVLPRAPLGSSSWTPLVRYLFLSLSHANTRGRSSGAHCSVQAAVRVRLSSPHAPRPSRPQPSAAGQRAWGERPSPAPSLRGALTPRVAAKP